MNLRRRIDRLAATASGIPFDPVVIFIQAVSRGADGELIEDVVSAHVSCLPGSEDLSWEREESESEADFMKRVRDSLGGDPRCVSVMDGL